MGIDTAQQAEQPQKRVGDGVKFQRIRRITGYLVGYLARFNNGPRNGTA